MKGRPNILLVTCDQWRADCISAAGHPTVRTPHVDALAKEGVLFRRHFAGAAPCSPARACLYTGLYQMNNRVCRNGTPLDRRHDTLALALRRAGYDPTLFGYTDTAPDPRGLAPGDPALSTYEGVLPGFTVRQLLPEHQKPWLSWLSARDVDISAGFPAIHRPVASKGERGISLAPPVYGRDETPTAFLAGEFLRWLGERADEERAWCAHVSFISPHPPFIVPEPFNRLYETGDGPPFRRAADRDAERAIHPFVGWDLARQKKASFRPGDKGSVTEWQEADFARLRALYFGMVTEVDSQLGRVFDGIKEAGHWDDTIIVVTSDHAEMMGDHHALGKGGFFDQSYHIPLVIRVPGMKRTGAVVDRFTSAVDLMPTLLDLLGEEVPVQLDGRSLAPFLRGKTSRDWREAAFWEFDFRSIGKQAAERHFGLPSEACNLAVLRTERAKYVHFGGGLPPILFDLERDPSETVNVAFDPAYLPLRLEMAERLLTLRVHHLDRTLSLSSVSDAGLIGRYARHPL